LFVLIGEMGGLCSKSSSRLDGHTFAKTTSGDGDADDDRYQSSVQKKSSNLTTPQTRLVQEQEQEEVQQPIAHFETYGTTGPDDFYDGIPRYNATASLKSRSIRSKQAAVAKVLLYLHNMSYVFFLWYYVALFLEY
jgi:hypothetical protein